MIKIFRLHLGTISINDAVQSSVEPLSLKISSLQDKFDEQEKTAEKIGTISINDAVKNSVEPLVEKIAFLKDKVDEQEITAVKLKDSIDNSIASLKNAVELFAEKTKNPELEEPEEIKKPKTRQRQSNLVVTNERLFFTINNNFKTMRELFRQEKPLKRKAATELTKVTANKIRRLRLRTKTPSKKQKTESDQRSGFFRKIVMGSNFMAFLMK